MRRLRLRALAMTFILLAAAIASTGASGATPKYPNLVGTWTGAYRFPSTTTAVDSHETLVIDRQDREVLWGHDQFVQAGQVVQIPVRGSLDLDRKGFGLAETSGLFVGRIVDRTTVEVRFFRTDDKYTSFAVRLHRAAP